MTARVGLAVGRSVAVEGRRVAFARTWGVAVREGLAEADDIVRATAV
jgi:hypothetical protein